MIGGGSEGDGDLHLVEGRKRVNEREREIRDGGIVGWFFGGGKFRDLFRWKVGRWTMGVCVVVAVTWPATLKAFPASYFSSFREFLSRMFTFPGSPFEDKRVCDRERGKDREKGREIGIERERNCFFSFSPSHWSISNRFVEARLDARKD